MASVTPDREPVTYRLNLGDDWYRIRLNKHAEIDVKAFLTPGTTTIPVHAEPMLLAVRSGWA